MGDEVAALVDCTTIDASVPIILQTLPVANGDSNLSEAADQGLAFLPPWPTLIGIGLAILAATLFTAWLHARQGAKVVIAEALRYQA